MQTCHQVVPIEITEFILDFWTNMMHIKQSFMNCKLIKQLKNFRLKLSLITNLSY